MKVFKKVIIAVIAIALVVAIVGVGQMFIYYPHYKSNQIKLTMDDFDKPGELKVMSCNLRCISPTDFGKKSWFYRADLIIKNIEAERPDVIGFQESTKFHYKYLTDTLIDYDSIITFRDKQFLSEGCPVFYRADKYKLIDKGSFWLSETPEEMSKDWDAACYRICSYVILETKDTNKKFVVFNTHLDHVSDEARINGINVILDKIKEFGGYPSMIMGDFNATEDSSTYKAATENFLDTKYQAPSFEESCTYQAFGEKLDNECIDYLMISKTGFKVNSFKVVTTTYDGVYPSDHFPLSISLQFDK